MLFVELVKGMLFVELMKVVGGCLWHNDMNDNRPKLVLDLFGGLVVAWKFNRNFSFSCYHEYIHFGGSLEYQFATTTSRNMIRDLARVASSLLVEAMAAS
jgi:hypothetical protein